MNQLRLFSRVTEYVSSDLVKEGGATYRFQRSGKYLSCVIVYFTFDQQLLLLLLYKCVLQAVKQARLSYSLRPKLCVYLTLSATWQPPSEEESAYLQKCFLRVSLWQQRQLQLILWVELDAQLLAVAASALKCQRSQCFSCSSSPNMIVQTHTPTQNTDWYWHHFLVLVMAIAFESQEYNPLFQCVNVSLCFDPT